MVKKATFLGFRGGRSP